MSQPSGAVHSSDILSTTDKYKSPSFGDIENLEQYQPGGFHPVSPGDVLADGRYKVLHKLGSGAQSTVWLARGPSGDLVTLKILTADKSDRPITDIADLYVSSVIDKLVDHPAQKNLRLVKDHFREEGPNGTHLCLVFPFSGPRLMSVPAYHSVNGPGRLRGDLVQKLARQLVAAVELLHSLNIVHGDLTPSNVLFQVSDEVSKWSDEDVYRIFGTPLLERVYTHDGSDPRPSAPLHVVKAIDGSTFTPFIQDQVLLIDFGASFSDDHTPKFPVIPYHYRAPEVLFDFRVGLQSDVWALACTIFEIRIGFPIFDSSANDDDELLKQMVETLGRLPEPWWSSWERKTAWFDEITGQPKRMPLKTEMRTMLRTSIGAKVLSIGVYRKEARGTVIDGCEAYCLTSMLVEMLDYHPEDRLTVKQVLNHEWFECKGFMSSRISPPPSPSFRETPLPVSHISPYSSPSLPDTPSPISHSVSSAVVTFLTFLTSFPFVIINYVRGVFR